MKVFGVGGVPLMVAKRPLGRVDGSGGGGDGGDGRCK